MTDLPYGNPEPIWEGSITIERSKISLSVNYGGFKLLGHQVKSLNLSFDCEPICRSDSLKAIADLEAKKILKNLLGCPVALGPVNVEAWSLRDSSMTEFRFTFLFRRVEGEN